MRANGRRAALASARVTMRARKQLTAFLAIVGCLALALPMSRTVAASGAVRAPSTRVAADDPPSVPDFDHIVVIVLENHSYGQIIGNPAAPYLNSLATQYGVAQQYYALKHGSLPNYLALTGGNTVVSNNCNDCFVSAPNLAVDRIESSGRTWKAYMESMPSACTLGDTDLYVQHHDPFVYYDDIRTVPSECANVVPYTDFAQDFSDPSTTPNFAWITPNLCDDMHNCSVAAGDAWLQQNVSAILASPAFTTQNSLLAITFDEDDGSAGNNNHIATVLAGPSVTQGLRSNVRYDHYSLLKTIETAWSLAPLSANDAAAIPMTDFFGPLPPANVVVSDSFTRSVSNGWGSADTGGPWSTTGSASGFAVNGSAATMTLQPGAGLSARLLSTTATNTDTTLRITVGTPPTSGGTYLAAIARRVSNGNEYRIRVHLLANGTVALSLSKLVAGKETVLTKEVPVAGLTFTAGTTYDLHTQISGTAPTTVQAHIWPDGTTEPTDWPLTTSDSTTALQQPGATGLWAYTAANTTNPPTTITYDDVTVTSNG